MRTIAYLLYSLAEAGADGIVWLWNKYGSTQPIKIDDFWTDGT